MLELSNRWAPVLASQPETGMGYQLVTVILRDGRRVDDVTIVGGMITGVAGRAEVPFTEDQIAQIEVVHRR